MTSGKNMVVKCLLILEGFRDGTMFNIKMQDNGLIYAGEQGKAVTWMDAVVAWETCYSTNWDDS